MLNNHMKHTRETWIDTAKGIAILCVVIGHSDWNSEVVNIEGFEKPINRNIYILLVLYCILYENSYRFCHSRRIFSG